MPSTVTALFQQWQSANGGALEAAQAVTQDSEGVRHSTEADEPAAALASNERPWKRAKAQHNNCRRVLATNLPLPGLLSWPIKSHSLTLVLDFPVALRILMSAYNTLHANLLIIAELCTRSLRERQLGVPRSAALQAVLAHSCRARWNAVCGPTRLPFRAGAPVDLSHRCRVC